MNMKNTTNKKHTIALSKSLKVYLKANKITYLQFAKDNGFVYQGIGNILKGRSFHYELGKRIEKIIEK